MTSSTAPRCDPRFPTPAVLLDNSALSRFWKCEALESLAGTVIVALDFLDTLAWLVGCGALDADRADAIELRARTDDGWKRPDGYAGSIDSERGARQAGVVARVAAWRARAG